MPPPPGNQICVCTIEKANAVVNALIEDNRLEEVGCVVVDEIHMISDSERGYLLELLLTKVHFVGKSKIQIIGMSATLPNVSELAMWLNGETYKSSFRPIPLKEYFKIGNVIYNKDGSISRQLKPSSDEQDRDHLIPLCEEILPEHSLLIFCPTKRGSQETALLLARRLSPSLREHKKQEKLLFLQQLRAINVNGNVDENLQETVPLGVAFHHSGLTVEERELIEQAFRDKVINIICCTSTLAAGVNLPARRVILRSPMMGGRYLTTRDYKQMSGRAGRVLQIDTLRESIPSESRC
jgi:replicative superfamily II helicase